MRRAHRLILTLGLALMASTGLALAKDTVTIGMVLEPPGLDPTSAPAAAIGEVTHYNIFEGLTKINEDFSVTPLLAEKWTFSPDLKTLTFTLKPNIKFQDDEPFSSKDVKYSFERYAATESTNKDKAFFASIESIDTPDPMTVVLNFKQPSFEALYHLGMDTAVILDEKSATAAATNPVGTGPYKLSSWEKGSSIVLDKWDGFRDAANIPIAHATFRFISDPSAAVAAMLAGDVDAFPRFANNAGARTSSRAIRASRCWSAAPRARPSSASTTKRSRLTMCACVRRSLMRSTARRSSTGLRTASARQSAAI